MSGNGYAQLENRCREKLGQKPLCGHLDFASQDKRQREWLDFLNSGRLTEPDGTDRPADFTKDDIWLDLLRDAVKDQERDNWYAHYQLGLHDVYRSDLEKAEEAFRRSLALKDTAWARHGLAVCCLRTGDHMAAVNEMMAGLNMRLTDLSYVKEGMKLLLQLRAYERVLEVYGRLSEELRGESRVRFNYIQALAELGRYQEAMDLLMADGGLEVADIREGEDRMKSLWEMLCGGLYGDKGRPIPHRLNFTALQEQ